MSKIPLKKFHNPWNFFLYIFHFIPQFFSFKISEIRHSRDVDVLPVDPIFLKVTPKENLIFLKENL